MRKITKEEIERRILNRYPTESFEILKYESLGQPMVLQCKNCNQIITVSKGSNFFIHTKKYGCVNCHGLWKEREKILSQVKEKYDIIGTQVKDTHTYYTIQCKNCGYVRENTLRAFEKHLKCGCSTGVYRKRTADFFLQETNNNSDIGPYELLSEYKGQTIKVLLKHLPCGFIWHVRPSEVVRGHSSCPKCRRAESKGESFIKSYLLKLGISFQQEFYIPTHQWLDFYFELNDKKFAIEYNGKQHYEETTFFKTTLAQQQERDLRKKNYCEQNNINLIVIPYFWPKAQIISHLSSQILGSTTISQREQNPSGLET